MKKIGPEEKEKQTSVRNTRNRKYFKELLKAGKMRNEINRHWI